MSGSRFAEIDELWPERRLGWFRSLTVLGMLVSVLSVIWFPWWPGDFETPTLLGFRTEALTDQYHDGLPGITLAYLGWGCFVQLGVLVLFAIAVFRPTVWWLPTAILALVLTIWQLAAMLIGELINTVVTAWLCPIIVFVLLICWLAMRPRPEPPPV